MGMYDHVVVLDETLRCPHGHPVEDFQTKSFADPWMATYLVAGAHVHLVTPGGLGDDTSAEHWRLAGDVAVFQRRHAVERINPPGEIAFYTSCGKCPPVLIRSEHPRAWDDLIDERRLWVEFLMTFVDGQRHIECTSGTRDDLMTELRKEGLRVMRDDEPLAIAHHEIRAARDAASPRRSRVHRRRP